ncbi:MAG: M20/M25/M40 family metallo-hydrolase, partial [Myxococcales bacterium]|nr:M20/M25/M40 family metallo-hydrolase [Myxococcales bacterium]
ESEGVTEGSSGCAPQSAGELMACVDRARYVAELEFIAAPRTPGSPRWGAVQARCAEVFKEAGFAVELQGYGTGVNVLGVRAGAGAPEERVVVSAHYDHIDSCPGADDNATGVAGVLELARALAHAELSRTVVLACWDEEELGRRGSIAYAAAASAASEVITAAYVFDMIGYASDEPDT